MKRILAISGSLRKQSSNTTMLRRAVEAAPAGITVTLSDAVRHLPLFSPDLDVDPLPSRVVAFRAEIGASDALLFSVPEYAHGIPGAFKNALDWLVSATEPIGKRVALWNASARASEFAHPHLIEVLRTMSIQIMTEASLETMAQDEHTLAHCLQALVEERSPSGNRVVEADLSNQDEAAAVVALLDMYANEAVAMGAALDPVVKRDLVHALRAHSGTHVFLAYRAGAPVGLAICFKGFSTFAAKPVLNIHDLAVAPLARRKGVARSLLAAIEARARTLRCAKMSLEVMSNNAPAMRLYESERFVPHSLAERAGSALLLEKALSQT